MIADKLPSTETVLVQSISKAQMCQDIFKHILDNKTITRTELLEYILSESESLTLLSQQLLAAMQEEQAAQLEARNKLIAAAEKALQDAQAQQVTEVKDSESEP